MIPEKIDHLCIAVKDLKASEKKWTKLMGKEPVLRYVDEKEKIDVVRYSIGESFIEIMTATDEESPVGKFLKKRGEGLYLISFKVNDSEGVLRELEGLGIKLIDKNLRKWRESSYFFLHPEETNGVLLEIID